MPYGGMWSRRVEHSGSVLAFELKWPGAEKATDTRRLGGHCNFQAVGSAPIMPGQRYAPTNSAATLSGWGGPTRPKRSAENLKGLHNGRRDPQGHTPNTKTWRHIPRSYRKYVPAVGRERGPEEVPHQATWGGRRQKTAGKPRGHARPPHGRNRSVQPAP